MADAVPLHQPNRHRDVLGGFIPARLNSRIQVGLVELIGKVSEAVLSTGLIAIVVLPTDMHYSLLAAVSSMVVSLIRCGTAVPSDVFLIDYKTLLAINN